jgi:hypothetical protein
MPAKRDQLYSVIRALSFNGVSGAHEQSVVAVVCQRCLRTRVLTGVCGVVSGPVSFSDGNTRHLTVQLYSFHSWPALGILPM